MPLSTCSLNKRPFYITLALLYFNSYLPINILAIIYENDNDFFKIYATILLHVTALDSCQKGLPYCTTQAHFTGKDENEQSESLIHQTVYCSKLELQRALMYLEIFKANRLTKVVTEIIFTPNTTS